MKRTLTLTFEYNDSWFDNNSEDPEINTPLGYAMDNVINSILSSDISFIDAKLDGHLLIDKEGNAPGKVKQLQQYLKFVKITARDQLHSNTAYPY